MAVATKKRSRAKYFKQGEAIRYKVGRGWADGSFAGYLNKEKSQCEIVTPSGKVMKRDAGNVRRKNG